MLQWKMSFTAFLLMRKDDCKIRVGGKYYFGEGFMNKFHCYWREKKDIKDSWCSSIQYKVLKFPLEHLCSIQHSSKKCRLTVCDSFENSRECIYDGVYFSKVARLQCDDSNFTISRLNQRFSSECAPKISCLKKNNLRKSLRSIKVLANFWPVTL